jgi:hypothetical protein
MFNRIGFHHILLSLLSPVIALIIGIRSNDKKYILFSGTLFMGFIGSVFIYLVLNDGHAHLMRAYEFYLDMGFYQFINDCWRLLTFQPTKSSNDLYIHIISYISAGIFKVPELIHVFGGLLLGYFFTKSVLIVLEDKSDKQSNPVIFGFLVLFLLSNSISALNVLRMWPAMWVFFYGAFSFIKRRNPKYLWFVALSIFIHFSYLMYLIPLIFAFLLRNYRITVVAIFILSNFISLDFDQANSILQKVGLYEEKASLVILDDEDKERIAQENQAQADTNFYKKFGTSLFQEFSTVFLAFTLILLYLSNVKIDYIDFLISGGLLILAFSNLAELSSPAIHGRGKTIASTFLVSASLIILLRRKDYLKSGIRSIAIYSLFGIFLLSCIPYILFQISYILNTVSLFIFFIPPISWVLGENDISIKDFLIFNF